MPLPTPVLDDLHFQRDIVDHAKRLIPLYCPEWTDHNVSDPGVTLIELFAWMTEMLLYRVNQVPDKMYLKFLEMIGVRLHPPRPASVPITFYLSAAQPREVSIPAETEVATIRTETEAPLIFTTASDLIIQPPGRPTLAFTRTANGTWLPHNLATLGKTTQHIEIFSTPPAVGDAFYIGLEKDLSSHVLALILRCEEARGAGVKLDEPPLVWEAFQGPVDWVACEVEKDETGGFNKSGEIVLHLPPTMRLHALQEQGTRAYWLRCRLTAAEYRVSPRLEALTLEARGGTVLARHATTVYDEMLGYSDGTPGQQFKLRHTPLLARDPTSDYLMVEPPNSPSEIWQEVADFAESEKDHPHFTLDSLDGTLTLGPSLLQPDGAVWNFGRVPLKGSVLRFKRYQYGGGVKGNLPPNTITVPKSSIPYVARVTNRKPAVGGRDAQSLDDARLRAPQQLRTRRRAVTSDDFEFLTGQVPGVARAHCLAPGAQPGEANAVPPGQVIVLVLPEVDHPDRPLTSTHLHLSADLERAVFAYLRERCVLGTRLRVEQPAFVWVSVEARIRLPVGTNSLLEDEVIEQVQTALYRYLNPYIGGPDGNGWPFGRELHLSELYRLIQDIRFVQVVESVQIYTLEHPESSNPPQPVTTHVNLGPREIICSHQHRVLVQRTR